MIIRDKRSKAVGLLALIIFISIEFYQHSARTHFCETTYIYEGYGQVQLPNEITSKHPTRYKLMSYLDQDPTLQQGIKELQGRSRTPVLFIHGHLGSHQQMRSMASESSRELIRRLFINDNNNIQGGWVDWYAVDFAAEPSAFQSFLLDQQADFVADIITHLFRDNSNKNKMVLVGYSMGGIVAQKALERLSSSADSSSSVVENGVGMLITLASPTHHLPHYMPPTASNKTKVNSYDIPILNIVPGPSDYMIPSLSAFSASSNKSSFTVDMEDIPGVWCGTHHKSIVSCNQLVRTLVPLILDTISIGSSSIDRGSSSLYSRMSSHVRETLTATASDISSTSSSSMCRASLSSLEEEKDKGLRTAKPIELKNTLSTIHVAPNTVQHVTWSSSITNRYTGALVLVSHATPCDDWSLVFTSSLDNNNNNKTVYYTKDDMSMLPPIWDGLHDQYRYSSISQPRFWRHVMDGINWSENATWLTYIPIEAGVHQLQQLNMTLIGTRSSKTNAMIQFVTTSSGGPLQQLPVVSLETGSGGLLGRGHSVVLPVVDLEAESKSLPTMMGLVNTLLFGHRSIPLRLVITDTMTSNATTIGQKAMLSPLFIALGSNTTNKKQADYIRFDTDIPLWHPAVKDRTVLLVSDPRIDTYIVSTTPDVILWIVHSLRYHIYCIPAVVAAMSILQILENKDDKTKTSKKSRVIVIMSTLVAVVGSLFGLVESWLPLSLLEGVAVIVVARGILFAVEVVALYGLVPVCNALFRVVVGQRFTTRRRIRLAILGVVVSSSILHPSLPPVLGILLLLCSSTSQQQWLTVHLCCSFSAASWLLGWLMSDASLLSGPTIYPFNDWSRLLLLITGLHAAVSAVYGPYKPLLTQPVLVIMIAARLCIMYGLWGRPYVALYAAVLVESWDLLQRCIVVGWLDTDDDERDDAASQKKTN